MMKQIIALFFKVAISFMHRVYGIEGVNTLLLFMPPRLIVPTLKKYGARVGKNADIHAPLIIHNAKDDYRNLEIGDDAYLGREVFLDLTQKITIGARAVISMRSTLLTHFDCGNSCLSKIMPPVSSGLVIGDDAYLGAAVTVKGGVKIGKEGLVAAMSFVNKDVEEKTMVGGVPIEIIKSL